MSKNCISFYDNLYGYISLDKKFSKIINNQLFTRLHNISQMGMTRYIFPDAVHTRFSHSLGVFYNVSRLFSSQENQFEELKGTPILNTDEKSTLELTALLHDIGHVPLSHTTEQAMKRFYNEEKNKVGTADFLSMSAVTSQTKFAEQEKQYENSDTKLHERLAEAVLLGSTTINSLVSDLGYSCTDISNGIMGLRNGQGFEEYPINDPDSNYLKHARNFMHSQLDADRLDYLIRDAAFSGVKAGAFDVEKLLREVRYDVDANYGVDEAGIRVLEQFFFARFGAYSQIVFNKKVHGLEYLAQEFYYRLLIKKRDKKIEQGLQDKILNFNELNDALREGNEKLFLSFTDSVFYELLERVIDGSLLITPDPHLVKIATILKNGTAPKVVGYEEYFATEEENRFHNSFFDYIRNKEKLEELSVKSGVPVDDIILPDKPLKTTLIDSKKDSLCVFRENKKNCESLLECDNSLLKLIQEKYLYVNRLFTFGEASQDKLKKACVEMSKGFSCPGDFQ